MHAVTLVEARVDRDSARAPLLVAWGLWRICVFGSCTRGQPRFSFSGDCGEVLIGRRA